MKNLLLALLLLVSTSSYASTLYEGKVSKAIGEARSLKGDKCQVSIKSSEGVILSIRMFVGEYEFTEKNLHPHFGGTHEFAPQYSVPIELINKYDTMVVFVHPLDHDMITSVVAFENDDSTLGYRYDLTCEINPL